MEAQHEPQLNGVREGRAGLAPGASGSGRRDRGCPQLGSSEVTWVAHGSSSSPPRTTETSVWGLCLWGFLKQDFGKTREASRVPSTPTPPTPTPAEPLLCDREASSEGTEGAFVTLPRGHTHCAMCYLGMPPCPSSLAPGTRGLVASEGHSLAPAAEEEQLCLLPLCPRSMQQHLPSGCWQRDPPRVLVGSASPPAGDSPADPSPA